MKDGLSLQRKYPDDLTVSYRDANYIILNLKNPLPRAFIVQADNLTDLTNKLLSLQQGKNLDSINPVRGFTIMDDGSENIAYTTLSKGYLVTTDNYYPGWSVEFNGQLVPAENALGLRAIPISPGQNSISIRYYPQNQAFGYGLKISITAFIVWLLIYFWFVKRKVSFRAL